MSTLIRTPLVELELNYNAAICHNLAPRGYRKPSDLRDIWGIGGLVGLTAGFFFFLATPLPGISVPQRLGIAIALATAFATLVAAPLLVLRRTCLAYVQPIAKPFSARTGDHRIVIGEDGIQETVGTDSLAIKWTEVAAFGSRPYGIVIVKKDLRSIVLARRTLPPDRYIELEKLIGASIEAAAELQRRKIAQVVDGKPTTDFGFDGAQAPRLRYDPIDSADGDKHTTSSAILSRLYWAIFGSYWHEALGIHPILAGLLVSGLAFATGGIHVALHEFSHAFAAWIQKIECPRIVIGVGRKLITFKVRESIVELRLWLNVSGYATMGPHPLAGHFRRATIIIAAGPLCDLTLCASAFALSGIASIDQIGIPFAESLHLIPTIVFIQTAITLFYGLIPWRRDAATTGHLVSDGNQLLRILGGKQNRKAFTDSVEMIRASLLEYKVAHVPEIPIHYRGKISAAFYRHFQLIAEKEYDYAVAVAEWLLDRPDLSDSERVFLLDILCSLPTFSLKAWQLRKRALDEWLPQAEAIASSGNQSLLATRGFLLVLDQQFEPAERILRRIEKETDNARRRALCHLFLALARIWQGDAAEGKAWYDLATRYEKRDSEPTFRSVSEYLAHPPREIGVKPIVPESSKVERP